MPFTVLPVSLVLAGACALFNIWLMMRVGSVRRRVGVSVGDGGSEPLIRRMRAQANFLESAPFVLLLVVLIEAATGQRGWLWAVAALFIAGRVAHAVGMDGNMRARMVGTVTTMAVLVALAIWAIAIPIAVRADMPRGEPVDTVVPAG